MRTIKVLKAGVANAHGLIVAKLPYGMILRRVVRAKLTIDTIRLAV